NNTPARFTVPLPPKGIPDTTVYTYVKAGGTSLLLSKVLWSEGDFPIISFHVFLLQQRRWLLQHEFNTKIDPLLKTAREQVLTCPAYGLMLTSAEEFQNMEDKPNKDTYVIDLQAPKIYFWSRTSNYLCPLAFKDDEARENFKAESQSRYKSAPYY